MSPAAAALSSPPPERRLLAPAWRQKQQQQGENNTTTITTTTHYEQHQRNISNSNKDDDDYGVTKSQEVEESSTNVDDYHDEIESVATSNEFNNNNKNNNNNKEDGHEEDTFIHIITDEQQISLHPPLTTCPLVLVNLVALTGCMPTSVSSKSILLTQLMESLLGSNSNSTSSSSASNSASSSSVSSNDDSNKNIHNDNDDNNNNMGDGLSLQFNERVNELFESGVAYHIDSSYDIVKYCNNATMINDINDDDKEHQNHPYVIIPYPEFLTDEGLSSLSSQQQQSSSQPQAATKQLRSTLRLWKLINTLPTTATSVSTTINTITNTSTNTTTPILPQQQQQQQQQLQMDIIQLMKRIFKHLCNTSRSLLWKADMYIELCYIFNNEYQILINKVHQHEYKHWSTIERKLRLDKLYDIRETFVCQVESVKHRYETLCNERESRVQVELVRRRRMLRGEMIPIMAPSNICDFVVDNDDDYDNNDGWGGETIHEDDIIGGGDDTTYYGEFVNGDNNDNLINNDDDDYNDDDDEEWSPLEITMKKKLNPSGMHIVINGIDIPHAVAATSNIEETGVVKQNDDTATNCQKNKLEPISHDENRQRITNRLLQQQNKWRQQQQQQQDEDETTTSPRHASSSTVYDKHHHLVRTWKEEEEIVRELLKTTDERIAEATLLKLEERLQNVDDLLESLQEEEWADDDDDVEDDVKDEREDEDDEIDSQLSSSLLDQILAMILGGLSKELVHFRSLSSLQAVKAAAVDVLTNNITDEEHFRYIKEEHESIVNEWIQVFGRLPKLCQHSLEEVEPLTKETAATLTSEMIDNKKKLNDMQQFGSDGGTTVPKDSCTFVRSDDCIDNKKFTPIDNENSTWDEVEDWDALFP
jgi:hypothetical protein